MPLLFAVFINGAERQREKQRKESRAELAIVVGGLGAGIKKLEKRKRMLNKHHEDYFRLYCATQRFDSVCYCLNSSGDTAALITAREKTDEERKNPTTS